MSRNRTIGTDGSACRTAASMLVRSVAGGTVVRNTMLIVFGAKLIGAGAIAV